jgi:hypothetical protein
MKRTPLVLAVLAAGIAAVTVAAFSLAAGGKAASGGTIHLVEKSQSFYYVDNRPLQAPNEPPSQGDMFAISSNLLSTSGQRAGTLHAYCVFATGGGTPVTECTGSIALTGGTLVGVTTVRGDTNRVDVALLGGTGAYEGARGSFVSISKPNSNNSHDTVHLVLP